LHYNYFQDYEAGTGRYVESDPIGLMGGVNTYSYARSNSIIFLDQTGLVTWKGVGGLFSIIIGGGVYLDHYLLRTDCVNGKQGWVSFYASGTAVGFGLQATGGGGQITFEDFRDEIDPTVFEGRYMKLSYGGAIGWGWGGSVIEAGGARSISPWGAVAGLDYSVWATAGRSWINNSSIKDCECKI